MIASHAPDRLLCRASFGPRPGEIEALRAAEPGAWLDRQLRPEAIDDTRLARRLAELEARELEPGDREAPIGREPGMFGDTQAARKQRRERMRRLAGFAVGARLVRAAHAERQLLEVMVDFWANHFSVFALKGPVGALLERYERDALRPHALGRFEDLLVAVARSPAMLLYLDNVRSGVPRRAARMFSKAPSGINENYARELLELHTLGVDGGYDQADVIEAARALTGWSVQRGDGVRFKFRRFLHDDGAGRILGREPEGRGVEQGLWLLRTLARHPATARHVSRKLVRRFVADVPPAGLVERAAACFRETDGDIASVLRVILLSSEFADPRHRKLKTPVEWFASALRATGGSTDASQPLRRQLALLGELPWFARTPRGFPDETAEWLDPSSMLARMSFAFRLARGLDGTKLGSELPPTEARPPASLPTHERVALAVAAPEFQWQ